MCRYVCAGRGVQGLEGTGYRVWRVQGTGSGGYRVESLEGTVRKFENTSLRTKQTSTTTRLS
jgi:hypothetical protein